MRIGRQVSNQTPVLKILIFNTGVLITGVLLVYNKAFKNDFIVALQSSPYNFWSQEGDCIIIWWFSRGH